LQTPTARIVHRMPNRVRFRIQARKGDEEYFSDAARRMAEALEPERLEANPGTGSLLIQDPELDLDAVLELALEEGLFQLETVHPASLARRVTSPIVELSARLKDSTLGRLDLATLAFLALIGVGTYQLVRSGLRSPPWYTAFWYAMGIYFKSLADRKDNSSVA
jgi:hypothetical protein